jgi:hypothetical protein
MQYCLAREKTQQSVASICEITSAVLFSMAWHARLDASVTLHIAVKCTSRVEEYVRCSVQGLQWSAEDCEGHLFPKLRLKIRPNLVQLAGGTRNLPITDPQVSVANALTDRLTGWMSISLVQKTVIFPIVILLCTLG